MALDLVVILTVKEVKFKILVSLVESLLVACQAATFY